MKRLLTLIIFIPVIAAFFCSSAHAINLNQTYTFDEDFDNGTMAGLEHETVHNQLQISNPSTTIPFIWIPNSNEGTVSKVDTMTGNELGRYRVSPFPDSSPSRTTVDLQGNCWVANRQTGTVVKIGLYENGGYIDRNLNGIIETSKDLNDDGIISGGELLPWGLDECVLHDIILIPGKEGTYIPGQYTGDYANDSFNPGPRGIAVDAQDSIWVGSYATMKFYYINGSDGQIIRVVDISSVNHTSYGAIIDENGILWSSGHNGTNVLRLDPKTNSFTKINIGHFVYGLGIDRSNHLFVSGWVDSKLTRINTLTGVIEWTKSCPTQSRGITVTDDGDVWIANSLAGTVSRYSNDGFIKATINVGNTPTGLSMDADGKVWVVNNGDEYIHRIDPATNSIELSKKIHGGFHYGYSDMTGAISRTITTKMGTWILTHDSELNNAAWGTVSWNDFIPGGTGLKVQVRTSNDKTNWSTWKNTQNGIELSSTPPGRYLQVLTTFQILSGSKSPILYDLKVTANVADISITMADNYSPVSAGEELKYTLNVSNTGPSNAQNVIIHNQIPSQLQNVQYSTDNGVTWYTWNGELDLGDLEVNNSRTIFIKCKLNQSVPDGSIMDIFTVNSDTMDINALNNVFSKSTTILNKANLEISMNANTTSLPVGYNVKIRIIVKNNGPSDATGVKTTYYLPSGLKYLSSSSNSYNLLNGLWNIGNLTSGSTISLEITGKVENIGIVNNTATVLGNQIDQNTANNNANVFLNVYPGHWIIPGNSNNSGNRNLSSVSDMNHHGISGQTNKGSDPNNSVFDSYVKSLSGTINQYFSNNILYEINHFILDSIVLSLGPNSFLNGNSLGKTPSQILNHYFGKYMPSELKDNPFFLDVIGWMYGSSSLLQHMTHFNQFSFNNYAGNKASEATLKAWQTGNIWDFFDYNFYHIPGYSSFLNKVWGGENIKWFLDNFFGIDPNGNMSVGYFLLNLATIIPIGLVASIGGKLLVRFLPKAAVYLMKSPVVQFLLKNDTVQMIMKSGRQYLMDPLKRLEQFILLNLPKGLRNIKLKDIIKIIKKISNYINLSPKTWIKTIIKEISRSSWIYNNGLKLETKIYDKLKLWGKVLPREIPIIINGSIKIIFQGVKGGFNSILNIFSDMTPLAVKEWVHTSPWRMRTFSELKKLTSTKLYRDVHGFISPVIKRNAALHSVYKAAKKVNETVKKIPEIAKTVAKAVSNTIKTLAKSAKKVASKVVKKVKKVTKTAKKVVKKVVSTAKKVVSKAVKTVKNTVSSGINWLKGKIGW